MQENRIIDYRNTEVGMQNWEVCGRMLAHDLMDMAYIPEVKALLDFYSITSLPNGSHTMALPRKKLLDMKKVVAELKAAELKETKKKKK